MKYSSQGFHAEAPLCETRSVPSGRSRDDQPWMLFFWYQRIKDIWIFSQFLIQSISPHVICSKMPTGIHFPWPCNKNGRFTVTCRNPQFIVRCEFEKVFGNSNPTVITFRWIRRIKWKKYKNSIEVHLMSFSEAKSVWTMLFTTLYHAKLNLCYIVEGCIVNL